MLETYCTVHCAVDQHIYCMSRNFCGFIASRICFFLFFPHYSSNSVVIIWKALKDYLKDRLFEWLTFSCSSFDIDPTLIIPLFFSLLFPDLWIAVPAIQRPKISQTLDQSINNRSGSTHLPYTPPPSPIVYKQISVGKGSKRIIPCKLFVLEKALLPIHTVHISVD